MNKRVKMFLGTCCFMVLLLQTGTCAAFGLKDITSKLPGGGGDSEKKEANQPASTTGDCIPAGQGGKVGFVDKLKAQAVNKVIDTALEKIAGVEGVFLIQDKITDTCMADKYLAFSERSSKKIVEATNGVIENMAKSFKNQEDRKDLEAGSHAANQALEKGNCNDAVAKTGDCFSYFKTQLEKGAAVDKEILATIWADTKKLCVRDIEILSLAKHIASFAKENMPWALNNANRLKTFLGVAEGLAGQAQSLATTPKLISAHFDEHDKSLLEKANKRDTSIIDKELADERGYNAAEADQLMPG